MKNRIFLLAVFYSKYLLKVVVATLVGMLVCYSLGVDIQWGVIGGLLVMTHYLLRKFQNKND